MHTAADLATLDTIKAYIAKTYPRPADSPSWADYDLDKNGYSFSCTEAQQHIWNEFGAALITGTGAEDFIETERHRLIILDLLAMNEKPLTPLSDPLNPEVPAYFGDITGDEFGEYVRALRATYAHLLEYPYPVEMRELVRSLVLECWRENIQVLFQWGVHYDHEWRFLLSYKQDDLGFTTESQWKKCKDNLETWGVTAHDSLDGLSPVDFFKKAYTPLYENPRSLDPAAMLADKQLERLVAAMHADFEIIPFPNDPLYPTSITAS